MSKVQWFPIQNDNCLFFDIFYKNSKIYLILPIYNDVVNTENIIITVDDKLIDITNEFVKDIREPILIYVYNYVSDEPEIYVKVEYAGIVKDYCLQNIKIRDINYNLALTTLFKGDYILFPLFYDYYKNQGVEHFFMYYNGKITDDIERAFRKDDVTLVEWDYKYWNNKDEYKYTHHAQLGQMHHAIYRFGKNNCRYMIFCDLDEYLYTPNSKIIEFIKKHEEIDLFGFCNKWSQTVDGSIPISFPNEFLTSAEKNYPDRSKNIYKLDSVNTISIHNGHEYNVTPKAIKNLSMFHFFNWTNRSRKINDISFSSVCI